MGWLWPSNQPCAPVPLSACARYRDDTAARGAGACASVCPWMVEAAAQRETNPAARRGEQRRGEHFPARLLSSSVPRWQHSPSQRQRQQFNFKSPGGTPTMKSLQKEVNSLLLSFPSKYFFQAQQCCIYLRAQQRFLRGRADHGFTS